jgi:hypothetical protein
MTLRDLLTLFWTVVVGWINFAWYYLGWWQFTVSYECSLLVTIGVIH